MQLSSRHLLTTCLATVAWAHISSACSEGCPEGSTLVDGQCVVLKSVDEELPNETERPAADSGARDAGQPTDSGPAAPATAETECTSGANEPCSAGKGVCEQGERQCDEGRWTACRALAQSSPELCDNADNDCDGTVDGPGATCDKPDETCVEPGRCAQCVNDRDCAGLTKGCEVGKCESGKCEVEPLEEYSPCANGYCIDNACTPAREYRIENTDTGSSDGQVEYVGDDWEVTGSIHYASSAGAYFLAHFVGIRVEIYGGRNADRGITDYSICDAEGSSCSAPVARDHYNPTLQIEQLLWTSPALPFGEHTVKGRATGRMAAASTDAIIDLDYIDVK